MTHNNLTLYNAGLAMVAHINYWQNLNKKDPDLLRVGNLFPFSRKKDYMKDFTSKDGFGYYFNMYKGSIYEPINFKLFCNVQKFTFELKYASDSSYMVNEFTLEEFMESYNLIKAY